MSHTYAQNHLHVVFSTKERRKLIEKPVQPRLWSYMAGIARSNDFLVIANGGMEDHVHFLLQIPPALALAKLCPSFPSLGLRASFIKALRQAGRSTPLLHQRLGMGTGSPKLRTQTCHAQVPWLKIRSY